MKAVCHTDVTNPLQSLVKSICYSEAFNFTSEQTSWDCRHKKQATERYEKTVRLKHTNLQVDCLLILNDHLSKHLQMVLLLVTAVPKVS